ncbi:MAG: DUF882 domain-containing protein [Ruminococcaceae bacterium]|nr:DUF882 domain-containing protein [Oscillospiraceae bacterium]
MKQTTKKLTSLILIVALLFALCPAIFAYSQIGNGSQGQDVKTMQTMLNTVMNAGLSVDGICGPKSVAAIKNFQSAYGLSADGICGPQTWSKLETEYNARTRCTNHTKGSYLWPETSHPHYEYYKCANCGETFTDGSTTAMSSCTTCNPPSQSQSTQPTSSDVSSYATIRNGSQGNDVKTMQIMLNAVMNSGLDVDGICGTKSVTAIRNFQREYGLAIDGVCGKNTWAKLEKVYKERKINADNRNSATEENLPKKECSSHRFNSANGNKCLNCDYVYTPVFATINKTYQATRENVAVRNNYYAKSGSVVKHMKKDERVRIVSSFRNSVGNLWYKTSDGNYIFSDNLVESQATTAYGDTGIVTFSKSSDGGIYLTRNFKVAEFACKDGSDEIPIDMELVGWLQEIREHFGASVTITSGYRSPSHNKKIGGVADSYHLYGRAADIVVAGHTPKEVAQYAASIGVRGIELNAPYGYVHIDTRDVKYWFVPVWSNGKITGYREVPDFN